MNREINHCDLLYFVFDMGYIISPVCLIVHLYRFFATEKTHSLPSKNLASYCLGTILAYASGLAATWCEYGGVQCVNVVQIISSSCAYNSALLLFNMMLDTFLCLHNSVNKFRLSTGPRRRAFFIYSVFAWGGSSVISISTSVILMLPRTTESKMIREIVAFASICFLGAIYASCLILFCVSLYYLRSRRIGDRRVSHDNVSNAAIRIRLVLIAGITYILWFIIYVALAIIYTFYVKVVKVSLCDSIFEYNPFLPPFEGIFIFFGFTMKKGMFDDENKQSKRTSDTGPRTETVTTV